MSSRSPGCSPTIITRASAGPSPNTVFEPTRCSSHAVQRPAAWASFGNVGFAGTSGAAVSCGFAARAIRPRYPGAASAERLVARPLRRGQRVELGEGVRRELERVGADVLFDVAAALRAGDRQDVVALREDPRDRHLRRRRALALRDALDDLDDRLVRVERLLLESRVVAPEVEVVVERGGRDRPGQVPAPERREGDERGA